MKGFIYIENEKIGEAEFIIIDESMGGIGGDFIATENYMKFQASIRKCYDKKGIANSDDFNFKIIFSNGKETNSESGIGITDSKEFNEIYIESVGNDLAEIQMK